jgi:hypothetical protein
METTETQNQLTPLQKKIAKLEAEAKANLEKEIERVTKEEESKEARKVLSKKIYDEKVNLENRHNDYIKEFEKKYLVKYNLDETYKMGKDPKKLSVLEKCELVDKEIIDGKPKYKLSEDGKGIIGANGEKITSIIKFNDAENKKQTLGVTSYYKYLKPDTTKEEMEKLFPKKNIVIDKLTDGTITGK